MPGAAAHDVSQVVAQLQVHQLIAHDPSASLRAGLTSGQPTALRVGQLPRPDHELEGDQVGVGVCVGGLLGEHVPHRFGL